ncbi:TPA: hypothetical protein UM358_004140 [Stenotrophomonas maltophilia]|jgi:hypothetical protein|nr:hypothetical protein [Stenotrophomonas maltophilia]MCR1807493.1 hypothetical protein [Stenotrophomonas geniculata]MCU1142303.1 hypothetical protein [Stenotrophomonas maltophilia]MDA5338856.1 hypothetical protein [Stenotrophomonas maltophilia]UXF78784.1 hypothetical protein K7573_20715 [Stenotrophomonas maltophilia]HEL3009287.1 hypothetical protein [Stenotrophomonas maltophilia]
MVPVSSRIRKGLWQDMRREAFESGIPLQDLFNEACRRLLDERAASKKERK